MGAGAALLAILYALFQAVQSTSSAATPARTEEVAHSGGQPANAQGAPAAAATRRSLPPAARAAATTASDERAPSVSSSSSSDPNPPPASRANTKNLHFGGTQLRAQTAAVEPLVVKCVEADVAAGHSPTGKAMLTYIVAQHGDKVTVEQTGVDEDKTTLQGPELLECLHSTSLAMKFEGLPREAEALVVSRSVTLDHGKLTENKHVGFSYLR